ncbi:MAG: DUF885 domain-containing protein [Lachnospiraceae bacterium]|nr:DUF885 domain-containing protein [Lachnospiraceae bacterium]
MRHQTTKRLLPLLLSFCILLLSACGTKPQEDKKTTPDIPFGEFVDELYRTEVAADTLTLHYSLAHPENYGITAGDITLGSYSQKDVTDSIPEIEASRETLLSYDYDSLTKVEQVLYDCILFTMDSNLALSKYEYYSEPLGPTTGLQAQLPILLAEYHFYSKEDIETYLELLTQIKDYFEDIAQYEREKSAAGTFMSDSVAEEIISQCQNYIQNPEENLLIECFNNTVENFDGLTRDEIILYEEQNREAVLGSVIPAYELLIDTLTQLKGTAVYEGGVSSLPDGAAYFEALARYETGSSMTMKEMQKRLKTAVQTALVSMSAAQFTDTTLYSRYERMKYPATDPAEGLEYLKNAIKTDFPALDDVDYSVKYVHKSLQEYLSPAMYLVPPFDDRNNNNIYINQNPEYDLSSIFTTLAHEGYPGHLYQNVYYLSTDPQPLQQLLRTSGYTEGWGTYAELYGYTLAGFDEALAEFCRNNMTAILCLYGLTEIGVHYSGWDVDATVSFWSDYGIDAKTAKEIYGTILAEPCSYLPYCVGYLEFMDLKALAQEALGDAFSPLDFHTFILTLGPAPFATVKTALEEWISEQK